MSGVIIAGDTSGSVTLQAPAVAGTTVLTLPATSGTVQVSGSAGEFTSLTSSALTSGRVTYASTGGLLADSANLVWDNTNARLGLSINPPLAQLDIGSISTSTFRLSNYDSILTVGQITGEISFYQTDASSGGTGVTARIGTRSSTKPNDGTYFGTCADLSFFVSGLVDGGAYDNATLEALTIRAAGNVGIGNTTPVAKLDVVGTGKFSTTVGVGAATPSASGSGITFPATQSASTNANTLDDYEEGTFTPTISGSTTAGTGTYTGQFGVYTKVGSVVTVQVNVGISAHTGTGNILLTGLPFTSFATTDYWGSVSIGYVNNLTLTALNFPTGLITVNATNVALYQSPTGGGAASAVPMDTSFAIIFSATYRTT